MSSNTVYCYEVGDVLCASVYDGGKAEFSLSFSTELVSSGRTEIKHTDKEKFSLVLFHIGETYQIPKLIFRPKRCP